MHTRKFNICFIASFITLLLFSSTSFAFNLYYWQQNCWTPVLALTGGVAFTSDAGESTTLPIIDSSTYTYSAHHTDQSHSIWGGFIGAEGQFYPNWTTQLGLAFYQTKFSPKGTLVQGADAQSSDQYNYWYHVRARQFLLEGKFFFEWKQNIHPYLLAGLGVSNNRANNYLTNVPPFLTFTPEFSNHTTNAFTYDLGFGVDVDICPSWRIGAGYRFSDLGKVRLSDGFIDTVPTYDTLSQSHFYINEVVAQLTFLMN